MADSSPKSMTFLLKLSVSDQLPLFTSKLSRPDLSDSLFKEELPIFALNFTTAQDKLESKLFRMKDSLERQLHKP